MRTVRSVLSRTPGASTGRWPEKALAVVIAVAVVLSVVTAGVGGVTVADAPPEPPHVFYGTVENEEGELLPNETVEAVYNGSVVATDTTDSSGSYRIEVPSDTVADGETVTIRVRDRSATREFNTGSSSEINFSVVTTELVGYTVDQTSVVTGEPVTLTATVENTGEKAVSITLSFQADGTVFARRTVTVSGETTRQVTASQTFSTAGSHTVTVNNQPTTTIQVVAPASFDVTDLTAPTQVGTNETFTANATVENTGGQSGSTNVVVTFGGQEVSNQSITLDAGQSTNVSVQVSTDGLSTGSYTLSVGTADDQASTTVDVLAPANLTWEYQVNRTTIEPNESVTVTATVENTGGVEGNKTVTFSADGSVFATRNVTVPGGGSVTVEASTAFAAPGEHSVSILDAAPTTVTVLEPASFAITYQVNRTSIEPNGSVAVTATVENTGDLAGTTSVEFSADGSVFATRNVTVGGGNTTTTSVTTTFATPGEHTVSVGTLSPTTVEVFSPPAFSTRNVSIPSRILDNSSAPVEVTVENTGDLAGTTNVSLSVDGTIIATQGVALDGGESTRVTFTLDTTGISVGNHTVTVTVGNQTTSSTVLVAETVPDISISTTSLEFGNVSVGESASATVTVENTGNHPLEVTELRLVGADSDAFAVNETPFTLEVGESRTFNVTFAPSTLGAAEATLEVVSDDPDESVLEVTLAGVGRDAVLTLNKRALTYHSRSLDSRTNQTLLVTNEGNAPVEITDVAVNGPDASAFTVVAGTAPFGIPAGDTGEVTVQFSPGSEGPKTANLTLETDEGDVFTVPLSGVGETPDISVRPLTLGFGSTGIDSPVTRNVTIANNGSAPLSLDGVTLSGPAFSVVAGNASIELVPGETHTVTVRFDPDEGGAATGTLTVASDDPDESTVNVSLAGTGREPNVSVSTRSVAYGTLPTQSSTPRFITVTNDGNATLSVTNVTLSGDGAFSTIGAESFLVQAGSEKQVGIAFAPESSGTFTATLTVESNDPDTRSITVSLSGEGTASTVGAAPSTVKFGAVQPGTTVTRTVTIRNTGSTPVSIAEINLTGADTDEFAVQSGDAPFTLPPNGGSRNVTVTFTPDQIGDGSATLSVVDDAGDTRTSVTLGGTGAAPDIEVRTSSVTFADTRVDGTATRTIVVENTGNANLNLTSVSVAGDDAFSVRGGGTVPPGQTRRLTVQFSPGTTGSHSATLSVQSNDPDESTVTVGLSGESVTPEAGTDPDNLGFGNVTINTTVSRTVRVSNADNASASITITGTTIIGPDASAYELVGVTTPFTLEPGDARNLTVEFTPESSGRKFGRLRLFTNDPRTSQIDVFLSNTKTIIEVQSKDTREGAVKTNVTVRNAPNNTTIPANVSTQESLQSNVGIQELNVSVRQGGNFSVNMTQDDDPVAEDAPNFTGPGGKNVTPIHYIRVNKTLNNTDIKNASFTFRVSKVQLKRSGVAPEDLAIYRYVNGSWVELPTKLIEEKRTHFIYAAVTPGFSDFATGAKKPEFDITRAIIPPGTVRVKSIVLGDTVDIVVQITNEQGAADGTFTAKLLLDGEVVSKRDVTIAAGGTRQVRFTRQFSQEGTFRVLVNDVSAGSVEVSPPGQEDDQPSDQPADQPAEQPAPPPMRLESPTLSATELTVGEEVTVTVTVENPANQQQSQRVPLRLNGVTVDSVIVGLDAGGSREITFTYTFDRSGQFNVTVGDTAAGTVTVAEATPTPTETPETGTPETETGTPEPEPKFAVTDVSLGSTSAMAGEPVEVTATVENTGEAAGTFEVKLVVNGVTVATKTVDLDAGETTQVTFDRAFDTGGTYTVAVNGVDAGQITVSTPTPTASPTATETPTPEPEGGVFSPGFAPGLAVLALLAFALLARRSGRDGDS